LILPTKSVFED